MSVPAITDVGYVGRCPDCDFVLWLDPGTKRTVMCLCGGLVVNKDGLDDRTSVSPQSVDAVLLRQILDYNYADDATGMVNPERDAVMAWRARKRGERWR